MSSPQELRSKVEQYARELCGGLDYNHDFEHHVQFVARDAERIALAEGADTDVAWTAAVLHEIGLTVGRDGHDERSAQMAEEFLREQGADEAAIRAVVAAIRDNDYDRVSTSSLETQCLYDADNLQTVGPVGFARVFSDMLVVLDHLPRHEAMARLPVYQERQMHRLQTATGRRLAEEGHRLMQEFYKQYAAFFGVE